MRHHRGTALDAALVLGLLAAVLSLLDDTFADRRYLVAGLAPVVLLLAGALLARRVHEGGWWYLLGAVFLFAPLGGLAALRDPGPFLLLPTFDTMSRVLAQAWGAPVTLVSTVPPVDPTGVVMLAPFLVGFLAGVPAAWFAVASTRPLAPVVPVVLALAATIPVAVLTPSFLVPRAVVVTVVCLAWAAARARRRAVVTAGERGAAPAAAMAVVTVAVAAGLASLVVPDTGQPDRVLLRGDDARGDLSQPLLPDARDDIRLLTVDNLPAGRRIRFAALDLYDGTGWVAAPESPGSEGYGTFKRVGTEIAPLHPGTTTVVRVRVRPGYTSDWLPTIGELTSIDFAFNPGRTEVNDVRYNQASSSALVVGGVDPRDRYSFETVLGEEGIGRRDATREPTAEQRQPAGAFLDESLAPFDRDDLLPIERVLLFARYLHVNGVVRTSENFDQSPDFLEHRLLGARGIIGSQFQYSALMALGASRLGVPARVVTGAVPDRRGLVDYGDVTSWVELQLADGTWRTLEPDRYVGSRVEDAAVTSPPPDEFVAEELEKATSGKDREIQPVVEPDDEGARLTPAQLAVRLLGSLAALVLLALVLVPVLKVLRRARRRRTSSWSGTWVEAWQDVLDTARDLGRPVPEGWSRLAQARALGVDPGLARAADAAVFAPAPADPEEARAFWEDCQRVRRELLRETGARRRAWSRVNPASLVAAAARRGSVRSSGGRQVRDEDRRPGGQPAAHA